MMGGPLFVLTVIYPAAFALCSTWLLYDSHVFDTGRLPAAGLTVWLTVAACGLIDFRKLFFTEQSVEPANIYLGRLFGKYARVLVTVSVVYVLGRLIGFTFAWPAMLVGLGFFVVTRVRLEPPKPWRPR